MTGSIDDWLAGWLDRRLAMARKMIAERDGWLDGCLAG